MNQNEEKLVNVFINSVNVDESDVKTVTSDFVGWDSLSNMILISSLEDEFNIVIDVEDIAKITSFLDAKSLLSEKHGVSFEL